MSLLPGVTDILSHLLTDQIDFFLLSFVCLHCYLAESSIAQYSYSIKSFCLELLHPERQVVSDWWSLAVIILDCFSYENFESKREFVVYVQWPAAHSARGRESKTLKNHCRRTKWMIAKVHAVIMQIHLLSTEQFLTFANKTKRYLWILFSILCVCSGIEAHTKSGVSVEPLLLLLYQQQCMKKIENKTK